MISLIKNVLLLIAFFLLFSIPLVTPPPALASPSDVLIKNFLPFPNPGEDEWIELVNTSESSDQDLSELWLVFSREPVPGYDYTTKHPLSGVLAKQESLTITFSDQPRIPNLGGCISLASQNDGIVFSVQYGDGQCDTNIIPVDVTHLPIQRGVPIRVSEGINYLLNCRQFLPEPTYIHYDITGSTSTTLYLEPAQGPVTDYHLSYGLASGQDEHSVSCPHLAGQKFIECKIKGLNPNISYYFRAQAANGCARSGWSNEREIRTKPTNMPPTSEPKPLMKNGPTAAEILGIKIASSPSPTPQPSFPPITSPPPTRSNQENPLPKTNFLLSLLRFIINLFK
jgi:hypothetical protein